MSYALLLVLPTCYRIFCEFHLFSFFCHFYSRIYSLLKRKLKSQLFYLSSSSPSSLISVELEVRESLKTRCFDSMVDQCITLTARRLRTLRKLKLKVKDRKYATNRYSLSLFTIFTDFDRIFLFLDICR